MPHAAEILLPGGQMGGYDGHHQAENTEQTWDAGRRDSAVGFQPPKMGSMGLRHQAKRRDVNGAVTVPDPRTRPQQTTPADDPCHGQEDGSDVCFAMDPRPQVGKPRDRGQLLCFHPSQSSFKQPTVCKRPECKGKEVMACVLQGHTSQQRREFLQLNSRTFP